MSPDPSIAVAAGTVVLTTDALLTPDVRHAPGWVVVKGQRVLDVGPGTPPSGPAQHVGPLITPGLVDMHVHGAGGGDMTTGRPEDLDTATRTLLGAGITTAVVSLVTAPLDELERALESISGWAAQHRPDRTALAGIHVEGPFLSASHRGAHPEALLRDPDIGQMRRLLDAAAGAVRMVTLAPELPGSLALVGMLRDAGVTVAAGHTGAPHDKTLAAIQAGLTVATHLFNGMPRPHHRNPGPAWSLLADDRVVIEIINDGVHVHPSAASAAVRSAGDGRFALVSDGVAATAAPQGNYRLGPIDIRNHDGRVETADGSSLGGGNATLDACVRRAITVLGLDATTAVRAATTTPARALGLPPTTGRLVRGGPADLVAWDDSMRIRAVMRAGAWVDRDYSGRDGDRPGQVGASPSSDGRGVTPMVGQ